MPDIDELLANWDGLSELSQEMIDHLKSLAGQIPDDQKLKDYLMSDESNEKVA